MLLLLWSASVGNVSLKSFKRDPEREFCSRYNCCPRRSMSARMDCSDRNVTHLRHVAVPIGVYSVYLRNNNIESVDTDAFVRNPELIHIDLSHNKIVTLQGGWLSNMSGLTSLTLSHNHIQEILRGCFDGARGLLRLDLSYNKLQYLSADDIAMLENLEELILDHNPLALLSGDMFRPLAMLKTLSLNGVGYGSLPPDLFRYTSMLETLSLVGNGFKTIPVTALETLYSLRVLDLSQNPLTQLGMSCIRGLHSLRTLRLNDLYLLTSIDEGAFSDIPMLREIQLTYNPRLSFIHENAFYSPDYGQLIPVQEFYMRHTAVETLSVRLLDWNTVSVVDLTENPWNCDCRIEWMKNMADKLETGQRLLCARPLNLEGQSLLDLQAKDFSCDNPSAAELTTSIVMLVFLIFMSCLTVAGVLLYNHCTPVEMPDYSRVRMDPAYRRVGP